MTHPPNDNRQDLKHISTTDGLPVAPSLGPTLENEHVLHSTKLVDDRTLLMSAFAIGLALVMGVVAQLLVKLIALITNLAFFGRLSTEIVSPAGHSLGPWVIGVPVLGAIVVGIMARYGSKAIRGHGIPEAMEQVLVNESRIPARLTFLKPVSAAIAIGTGGPFGAEGPIIATGGAMGSVIGQIFPTTAAERKTLLAAGAAAGMTATFGSPVSAVILAIELLVFEFRPRSFLPICLAAATAAAVRLALVGGEPAFVMPDIAAPSGGAISFYLFEGFLIGFASVLITKAVYWIEDAFEKLPIHWMWWPALGGIAVGVVGLFAPRTLGVGYDNIETILSGTMTIGAIAFLCAMKFLSWSISLGSGTSGGTLAPLFTIGGGIGAVCGWAASALVPAAGVDIRIAALVGMAGVFAGASRALLASVVFAFETTRQPNGLLPLLAGCTTSYLISCLRMTHTIMTEKIARRGVRVPVEYAADFLEGVSVGSVAKRAPVVLRSEQTVRDAREALLSGNYPHQGYPIVDTAGTLVGVLTRRDLIERELDPEKRLGEVTTRALVTIFDDNSLRDAADVMVRENIGRLPVVTRAAPRRAIGFLTRSDLIGAHGRRLREATRTEKNISLLRPRRT